jgi:hypothetical protein
MKSNRFILKRSIILFSVTIIIATSVVIPLCLNRSTTIDANNYNGGYLDQPERVAENKTPNNSYPTPNLPIESQLPIEQLLPVTAENLNFDLDVADDTEISKHNINLTKNLSTKFNELSIDRTSIDNILNNIELSEADKYDAIYELAAINNVHLIDKLQFENVLPKLSQALSQTINPQDTNSANFVDTYSSLTEQQKNESQRTIAQITNKLQDILFDSDVITVEDFQQEAAVLINDIIAEHDQNDPLTQSVYYINLSTSVNDFIILKNENDILTHTIDFNTKSIVK